MRFDKFTVKSQQLVQEAQALAARNQNQQIEPEHLLVAMLAEKEGVAQAILQKLGVSVDAVARDAAAVVEKAAQGQWRRRPLHFPAHQQSARGGVRGSFEDEG